MLVGLEGLAVERVVLNMLAVKIVQLVTDDSDATRCPGRRSVSTSGKDWVLTYPWDLPCAGEFAMVQWRKRFTTLARLDALCHNHFTCNRHTLIEMPVLWTYVGGLVQTSGFDDTIDFVQIQQHCYQVRIDLNPSGIVPAGPDTSGWLTPHDRKELGGRPFGDGTPPEPLAAEMPASDGHGADE